ncbi:MAG TPA: MmgE/PrpD family protein [Acetobacteraceae bacterium]|nr:MmgE/PrpD family protein [Acetobacteraceae bacterium]
MSMSEGMAGEVIAGASPLLLTRHVSGFIAAAHEGTIPDPVIAAGRKSILDGLGLAVAGTASEAGHIITEYLRDLGVADSGVHRAASVLGTALRLPARFAAFANGIAIHAHDFDDTQLAAAPNRVYGLLMHPTAPVLAAVLAVAERERSSGAALEEAYHVGIEICCKIAEAANPRHYEDGFHTTGTCGVFGAAAGIANLLRLGAEEVATVLGLAGSQAAGLRENFGTMTKPFHPGRSAESAVLAADLVRRGFSATHNILEARRGFYHAACGGYDESAIHDRLGNPWTFASPGISIKPHPSGSLTHPAMAVILDLVTRHDVRADQVEQIRVGTNRHMPTTLLHHDPRTELEAKFSMEFCAAILVLRRRAGLGEFTDETVHRPEVRAMMRRVDFYVDPEAEAAGYHRMTSLIEIMLADGRRLTGRADFGRGSPANPMSWDEVAAKFRECADHGGLAPARAEEVIAMVEDLASLPDIHDLTSALTA